MINTELHNGDCLEYMKKIPTSSIDLIITDPPYNLGKFMEERDTNLVKMRDNFFGAAGWDDLDYKEWKKSMNKFFHQASRVLKDGGSIIVFMAIIKVETIIQLAQKHGLYYKTTGIWHKSNPMPRNMNLHFVNSTESWIYFTYKTKTGTFNNNGRKQNLLKTIYTYIANEKTDKNDVSYSLYGTNSFNLVWEKVCADNFGSVLDKKIVDLPLSNPEWNKVEYKDKTLRKVIKSPRWRKIEFPDVEDPKVETLKPDLVCIYPVDEQKKDYCFGIYDAKYYCIDYQIHGDKVIISGQPGVGDVTKQYLYQLAFDDFIMKQGYRYVQNMFFCPDEVGDKQYGWVQMEILNHIGNKRLENIAVVKLCASKMYQLYLDNQTISEHEINQYIADIGRQEISEQNFANRMLAYLMRITNASKMAEEKLEMKADKGKLIYPRQIKRELGAKIIYDAICPVASKAFYGFNPYEKENYGTMVAEDIGNSYGRCNQIADASIEIEKKIKELSEKELQDEKVIIDILRKCFEGKEDIASMAEGDNLEMLVEKVMELVRNLYL